MECVFISEIAYIESDGAYSSIFIDKTGIRVKKICKTLKFIEKNLEDKGFISCHISYIINIKKIEYFCSESKIVIVSGNTIHVSRRKSAECFRKLLENGINDHRKNTV